MTEPNHQPRIIDDPTVRETYADKVVSVSFDGITVVVTMGVRRMMPERIDGPPKLPSVQVTDRLAWSPATAVEVVNAISSILNAATLAMARPPNASGAPIRNAN